MRLAILLLLLVASFAAAAAAAAEPPDADRPRLLEAEQSLAQGRTEQALRQVNDYLAASPRSPRGYFLRAAIFDADRAYARSVPDYDRALEFDPAFAPAYQRRGVAHFMLGHVKESIADFDKFLELRPDERPHHWQRGIALYYAGRYEDGARQFELHKTVNPDDVENAAWHFLCMARWKGLDAARAQLIPVTGDPRVPMAQVQQMFAGKVTPEDVLAAANTAPARANEESGRAGPGLNPQLNRQLFYAHLYIGLYEEARNHPDKAKDHLTTAVGKHPIPDYMYGVAKVHLQLLKPPIK